MNVIISIFITMESISSSTRPWDPENDVMQYEWNGEIRTKSRRRNTVMKSHVKRESSLTGNNSRKVVRMNSHRKQVESSSDDSSITHSSGSEKREISMRNSPNFREFKHLQDLVVSLHAQQDKWSQQMDNLQKSVDTIEQHLQSRTNYRHLLTPFRLVWIMLSVFVGLVASLCVYYK